MFINEENIKNVETTSGPDGTFQLRVPRPEPSALVLNGGPSFPWLVGSAPGFGPFFVTNVLKKAPNGEVTIRLVADGPPIEGRIVDLEGRPVASAHVKVDFLFYPHPGHGYADSDFLQESGDLSDWIKRVKEAGVKGPWDGLGQFPFKITTTTGLDGRFRLTGVGRERMAKILVSAPSIATSALNVLCREGPEVRGANTLSQEREQIVLHAARFEYAAAPSQPIEGVIHDTDTGRPVAGIRLRGMATKAHSHIWAEGVEATTDADGRYRLDGLPKSPEYTLFTFCKPGVPYLNGTYQVLARLPRLGTITFDLALKRAVLVRGRVTDKVTGKPVPGYIESHTFRENPHLKDYPGFTQGYPMHVVLDKDGRYEIPAVPGTCILTCRSDMLRYRGGLGVEALKAKYKSKYDVAMAGFMTAPRPTMPSDCHAMAEVDLDPKADSATLDLQVDPGRTVQVKVVDPEGKPVAPTQVSGLTDLFGVTVRAQDAATFEVFGLDPSKPRRVTVTHPDRRLIGSVLLTGEEKGSVTIKIQPWGTLTGRIIDDEGEPRKGLSLSGFGYFSTDENDPAAKAERGDLPGNGQFHTLADGRFRVEGLVPGLKYSASASKQHMFQGDVFRDAVVKAGEVKDLGDLKTVRPKMLGGK
jgi:hypothetical protein